MSAHAWLVAHHTALTLPTGLFAFAPLGLALLPAVLLWVAGGRAVRAAQVRDPRSALKLTGLLSLTYGLVATAVAVASASGAVRPVPWTAFLGATALALIAGGGGVVRAAGVRSPLLDRVPDRLRDAAAAAGVAVAVVLAGGALLAAGSLAWHLERAVGISRDLDAGAVGGLLVALLGVGSAPNAAVWGAGYLAGPGFAVGTGTSVAPGGVSLGAVPSFPIMAALPADRPGSVVAWSVLAVPVLAGLLAGWVLCRRRPQHDWTSDAIDVALTAAAAGAGLGLLCALAGGPVAAGRLGAVGPSPGRVALALAAEVAVGAGLVLVARALREHRRARHTGAPEVDAEPL
jgi:hypothetical protein